MKKISMFFWVLLLLGSGLAVAERYPVEKKEMIQKNLTFPDPKGVKELQVDNVWGFISVKGYSGAEVQLLVTKTIKAKSQDRLEKAREEVSLDITTEGNTIDLYVNGPFRCREGRGNSIHGRDPGYQVNYDFELKVPYKTNLYVKTVTDGNITLEGVEGDFEVKNVNGKIDMKDVAGAGEAHTVNGWVKVVFSRNPKSPCSFHTVNGDLEISFPEAPSAEFLLKTFNGDIYSDFPVKYLVSQPGKGERKEGKYVYQSSRFFSVQSGTGGPEIRLDTLNGDILLAQKNKAN
ncbi:MAG: DUF4097 family beta strand repeat protein [Candidatus Aminicenantes bacterium]|nr:DUF4097 family beta strand repeat protein [Candidatus Aminicenantes bacterium]